MITVPAMRRGSESPPFRYTRLDGGLNVQDIESEITDIQSPYLLNVVADDRGAISKRYGWINLYTNSLGAGAVHGYWDYRKIDGTTTALIHHGTKLYTQSGTNDPVEIASGLADQKGVAWVFNDTWYYVDGVAPWQYDGSSATTVIGYVPTPVMGANPTTGLGTLNEDLNYFSNSFKISYSGNGTTAVYQLPYTGLTATTILAWIAGVAKTEGTHFTVNRTNGTIDWTAGTSPHGVPASGTDNVLIQGEKANLMDRTIICKNKYVELFGGANDSRIHLTGNPDAPSTHYYSAVDDGINMAPTYWPENNIRLVGSDADYNKGFKVQYDQLILLKERSIWRIEYEISDAGVVDFPAYPLNNTTGCDMPETIQLIDNNIVFSNTYAGPQILTRTDVRTERNVRPLGSNINGAPWRTGLLDEAKADLQAATSMDWDGKYIICVGSKCWLWDYSLSPYVESMDAKADQQRLSWWYWENTNANSWLIRDNVLYFGDRTTGMVKKFHTNYNDNGAAINGVWRSKLSYFGLPEWKKNIREVYFRTRATNDSIISITYYDDNGSSVGTVTITSASFSWASFAWDLFSWAVQRYFPPKKLKPNKKKVTYFQIEFSNNRVNENLSIMDLEIYFDLVQKAK